MSKSQVDYFRLVIIVVVVLFAIALPFLIVFVRGWNEIGFTHSESIHDEFPSPDGKYVATWSIIGGGPEGGIDRVFIRARGTPLKMTSDDRIAGEPVWSDPYAIVDKVGWDGDKRLVIKSGNCGRDGMIVFPIRSLWNDVEVVGIECISGGSSAK